MIFKCPDCGKTSDYLNVDVVNIVQTTTAHIGDHDILFSDYDTDYDDCEDIYYCPHCGDPLPLVHDEDALLKYLKENQ
jgi:hypothetical protein